MWDSLVKECKKISHDDYDGPRKSDNNLLDVMCSLSFRLQLWNTETEMFKDAALKKKTERHKLRLQCQSKRWWRFRKWLFDNLICPLMPFTRPQSQSEWSHYLKQWRNYPVANLHMPQLCGLHPKAESAGVTVRLLPRAARHDFL